MKPLDNQTTKLSARSCTIGMLVLPGFNSMAANTFLDPFRVTNYLHGESIYDWLFISLDGGNVTASNALVMADTVAFDTVTTNIDLLVINASWAPERFRQRQFQNWLKRQTQLGATLVAIDTGAFVLAFAGLLDSYKTVVHYEHQAAFGELFPRIAVEQSLYVIDHDRLSCCGGVASADLALEIIHLQQGIDLSNATARYIFHERLRHGEEEQISSSHEPVGYTIHEQVREAIILMQRNLEEILSLAEITSYLNVSQRHLQRLFARYTGKTPVRFYLDLRLDRARGLVTQTEISLTEIAGSCGFNRSEPFSRAYRKRFGLSPSRDRTEGRVPFQFRSFPSHADI